MSSKYNSLMIFMFFFIHLLLLPHAFSLSSIAKPNCTDRCGNVSIPYPFGISPSCSLGPSFLINCNQSSPPKPYLTKMSNMMNAKVIGINLNPPQIRVEYVNLALSCYGEGNERSYNTGFNLSSTQYSLSDENWLTAIGCDDMMAVVGDVGRSFGGGCVSYCQDRNGASGVNGSCPASDNGSELGNGCCRTPIPRGTTSLQINLTDVSQNWNRTKKLYSCSYAFLGEKQQSGFSYPFTYLNMSTKYDKHLDISTKYDRDLDIQHSCIGHSKPNIEYLDISTRFDKHHPYPDTLHVPSPTMCDRTRYRTLRRDHNVVENITAPVVLDWRIIGSQSCEEARQNKSSYACQSIKSNCETANIGGYFCKCSKGYEGNPYITQGCKDIDECGNSTLNNCQNYTCMNTEGSFKCLCPKGYHGYIDRDAFGCVKLPVPKMLIVSIGLASGMGFLLLLFVCFSLYKILKRREKKLRKEKNFKRNHDLLLKQLGNEGPIGQRKYFTEKELEKATAHFNESRILGHGGQGTVYKGMLTDGENVAIKKSKLANDDQLGQFINEVALLTQINHRNVVRMLGCCLEIEVPLLVFEFMSNGTLFDLIHKTNIGFPFSWTMRLKIAADIAGALAYLHSAFSVPIFHRDIKSSNILLGEKYVAKVSDFGISKSFTEDQNHFTTRVKGTTGYVDPEYLQSGQFTDKSDVYSFGVVLLELLTGKMPTSLAAVQFLECMDANNLDKILDPQVVEQGRKEEIIEVAGLAKRCLDSQGKMRPDMKTVSTELESLSQKNQMPSTIKDDECKEERSVCEAKTIMSSDNEYTWTASINSEASSSSPAP